MTGTPSLCVPVTPISGPPSRTTSAKAPTSARACSVLTDASALAWASSAARSNPSAASLDSSHSANRAAAASGWNWTPHAAAPTRNACTRHCSDVARCTAPGGSVVIESLWFWIMRSSS